MFFAPPPPPPLPPPGLLAVMKLSVAWAGACLLEGGGGENSKIHKHQWSSVIIFVTSEADYILEEQLLKKMWQTDAFGLEFWEVTYSLCL